MGHYVLNGLLREGSQSVSLFNSSEYDDIWVEAEQKTAELLVQIQPSRPSEEHRMAVINYIQQLIEREFNCKVEKHFVSALKPSFEPHLSKERLLGHPFLQDGRAEILPLVIHLYMPFVFPFGSVPLKTYLPDGDIDLTAISELHHFNDTWAKSVSAILEREERSHNSEFQVKEVKCIYAEVPVVKCLVENIIVDISFNQLGGLSTLCFLEDVDRLIARDHLFKRSVILVKAWCFYESRILGAHCGLLSTYALEVLVLYVFHVFSHSLRGPLEVLFRFLQFFSKFDWDRYCLSLWGPIPLVSLHNTMAVESPQNSSDNLLLSEEYLNACREKYSTLLEGAQGKIFSRKFMNLVDPLRPFNNLGRSVNRGNFVRIHSAFAFGAAQLEKLLQSPKENFPESLAAFFRNTHRHCRGLCPDASVLGFQINVFMCNDKDRSKDAISDMIAESSEIMDVATSEQEDADQTDGACLNKISHGNDDNMHSQVDDANQCSSGTELYTMATVSNGVDNRALNCIYDEDSPICLSDVANEPSRRVKSVDFDIDKYEKRIAYLNLFSETLVNDLMPKDKNSSADADDLVSCENIHCDHVFLNNFKTKTQSEEDSSSSPMATQSMVLVNSSEVGACKLGEDTPCKNQMTQEEALNDKIQADTFGRDFTHRFQTSEVRDINADILRGDYTTHLQNLGVGLFYQNSRLHGSAPYASSPKLVQGGFALEGPRGSIAMNLDHFAQSTSGRNGAPAVSSHGGSPQNRCAVPNNILAEGFSKHKKGTGTFFPNLKPSFDRDTHLMTNGIRGPRRVIGGIDSFNSAGHNGAPAFRPRFHVPKKYDGSNKWRTRKSTDLKAGEQDWDLLAEEGVLGSVLHSPTTNVVGNFVHPFERHMDMGVSGDPRINMIDWSPRSSAAAMVLPSGNSKDLPLEKLEFGSFGPGFLAGGLQDVSTDKDSVESVLQTQHDSPRGEPLEASEAVLKARHHVDQDQRAQSFYQLKEEDFPPLPFYNQRGLPNTFAAEKNTRQGSYHQACLVGHSL